jgi:hypothetical protein
MIKRESRSMPRKVCRSTFFPLIGEPLVPGPSRLEVEIAIAKLKKYKSPGSD